MVGAILAGGGGFGGVAAYCLEEKLQEQERQEEEERLEREREQEDREWMPDQGGASEEARGREETDVLSARDRQQGQDSPSWSRSSARRGDDEEEKKREADRERGRKAGGTRRLAARVEWTETRNLATNDPWRAARIMGATAADGPELKRLVGGRATGRKLTKPVCHYTLNWAPEERPDRQEMSRAVTGSLQALGLDKRQTLIVAHGDRPHAHVHVIVNRVSPENGKAAPLSRSRLKLSKWAEGYERGQGKIRCLTRERHNRKRARGERVERQRRLPHTRFQRERGVAPLPRRQPPERARLNAAEQKQWKRIERSVWEQSTSSRTQWLSDLSRRATREWRDLYKRQRQERRAEAKTASTLRGRFRRWREKGSRLGQLRATLTRDSDIWRGWRSEMGARHKRERVELGKEHTARAQEVEVLGKRHYNYEVALEVRSVEIASLDRRDRETRERIAKWRKEHGVQPRRDPEPQKGPERLPTRDFGPSR